MICSCYGRCNVCNISQERNGTGEVGVGSAEIKVVVRRNSLGKLSSTLKYVYSAKCTMGNIYKGKCSVLLCLVLRQITVSVGE